MFSNGKKFLKKLLESKKFLDIFPVITLQIFILNKLNKSKNGVFKIKHTSDLKATKNLEKGYNYISETQNNIEITVPDLNLYTVKNAVINSRSSAIVNGKNIFHESINDNERFNEGFITTHSTKNAILKLDEIIDIEEGFFLAGNG